MLIKFKIILSYMLSHYLSSFCCVSLLGQSVLEGNCDKVVETEEKYTERWPDLGNSRPRPRPLIRLKQGIGQRNRQLQGLGNLFPSPGVRDRYIKQNLSHHLTWLGEQIQILSWMFITIHLRNYIRLQMKKALTMKQY